MGEARVTQIVHRVIVNGAAVGAVVHRTRVETAVRGLVGPSGPQGIQGLPGVGGALASEEFTAEGSGEIQYELAHEPASVSLFVNGLRQSEGSFGVAGQTVTLPADLDVREGDTVTLEYLYEV